MTSCAQQQKKPDKAGEDRQHTDALYDTGERLRSGEVRSADQGQAGK